MSKRGRSNSFQQSETGVHRRINDDGRTKHFIVQATIFDRIGGVAGSTLISFNKVGCNSQAEITTTCNPAPIVGSGNNNRFLQACPDCIPQGLMTVFPNPTSTIVNVKWSGENPSGTVELTDLLGRVLQEKVLTNVNQFDVLQLPSGVYAVRVKADGYKQQVERVVVER